MKKTIFVLVNITLFVLFIFVADYFTSKAEFDKQIKCATETMQHHADYEKVKQNFGKFEYSLELKPFQTFWNEVKKSFPSLRRFVKGKNAKKNSVIVFGCSFAEGAFLQDNETFEYKLSKLTGRTVYNRGYNGFGIAPMLWQVKNNEFYDYIDPPPEYVIYIYILDHTRRIYFDKYGFSHNKTFISYEKENNSLVEKIPKFLQLNRFNIISSFTKNVIFRRELSIDNDDKNFDILKLFFEETRRELQKRYPDIKFIIIKHPTGLADINPKDEYSLGYSYKTLRWKELEDEGFIVYDLNQKLDFDITSDKYTLPDGHPNANAWDVITKKLTEDLKL